MGKTLSPRMGANVLLLLVAAMLSVSCSSMKGTFKKVDLTKISIGMAKDEVIGALGKDPANTVAAKQFDDGVMEVLEYHDYVSPDASSHDNFETYWLYFFNDRLVEWGKPPVDWEVYVERIYRQRHRSEHR